MADFSNSYPNKLGTLIFRQFYPDYVDIPSKKIPNLFKLLLGPEYTSKAYLASSTSSSIAYEFFLNPCITMTFLFLFLFFSFKSQYLHATSNPTTKMHEWTKTTIYLTIEGEDKSDNDLGMWR